MKPTLVILAAGMGSRYGGLKQLDGLGPNGETILEYTIYDAIQAGYGKVVCVIRKHFEEAFREAVVAKVEDHIEVECVFQELDMLPDGLNVPEGREKPWGTAHAVWVANDAVHTPFALVNADDFYGRESLQVMADWLSRAKAEELAGCLVGFKLKNTLSDHGSVSRGVCTTDADGNLSHIVERTSIARDDSGQVFYEEEGEKHPLDEEVLVSMNLMGFTPSVFDEITEGFKDFYKRRHSELKAEYYIPDVLKAMINQGIRVPVLPTSASWFGVTYREDKEKVQAELRVLSEQGEYPDRLWE